MEENNNTFNQNDNKLKIISCLTASGKTSNKRIYWIYIWEKEIMVLFRNNYLDIVSLKKRVAF